jgi:hypothetical protein
VTPRRDNSARQLNYSFPEFSNKTHRFSFFGPDLHTIFYLDQIPPEVRSFRSDRHFVCFHYRVPEGFVKIQIKYRLPDGNQFEAYETDDPTGFTFLSTLAPWAWVIIGLSVAAVIGFVAAIVVKRLRRRVTRLEIREESEA